MPYIEEYRRARLEMSVGDVQTDLLDLNWTKGDMNYCITQLVLAYTEYHGKSYNTLSDVTGVLNDVKTEFERRVVAPYEDKKIGQNGDVYDDPAVYDD